MQNNSNIDLGNLELFQLGYVYKDIEKQAKIMETMYGVSKFWISDPLKLRITYRGVKTKIMVRGAFAQYNKTQLELIQLIEGDSIYKEFLDQGREGLHHVLYRVDDLQAVINKYKEVGIEVIQSGRIMTSSYAYMDTEEKLGIIVEFGQGGKGGLI
jgi:hypothetical protein